MKTCKKKLYESSAMILVHVVCCVKYITSFNHTASSDLVYNQSRSPSFTLRENTAMEICSAASGTTLAVLEDVDVEGQTTKTVKQRLATNLGISRFRQRMLSTHMGIPFLFFGAGPILMQLQSFFCHFSFFFFFLG